MREWRLFVGIVLLELSYNYGIYFTVMDYLAVAITGAAFALLALLLTKKNARFLLAGYNTLSEEERKNFDLTGFLKYYRQFHLFLALSVLILGSIAVSLFSGTLPAGLITIYVLICYIVFLRRTSRFSGPVMQARNKAGIFLLGLSVLIVIVLLLIA